MAVIHDQDWHDSEDRNEGGYPYTSGPVTKPRATVHPGGAITSSTLDMRTDQSVNKALPWVAFSWFLSGGAIVGLIVAVLAMQGRIESEGRAVKAEVAAQVEARVARAEALAELARKEASTAKDMVDLDRAKNKALEELNVGRRAAPSR